MTVFVSMLRGVNLGPHRRLKMDELCSVYESLKLRDVQSFLQSGNVLFRTDAKDEDALKNRLEKSIQQRFGFSSDVILRTTAELKNVIAKNPFAKRRDIEPAKLLVTFLATDPGEAARKQVREIKTAPEDLRIQGREIYTYYPNGMARPKVPWAAIERIIKTSGTGRNWNTVTKLLELAEKLEASR